MYLGCEIRVVSSMIGQFALDSEVTHSEIRLEVRGGIVKRVTRPGSLNPRHATVEELFASTPNASMSGRYARVEGTYGTKSGYPSRIVFTANKDILDGNSIIEISAFEDLAGQ
jgi:hypothetical protein